MKTKLHGATSWMGIACWVLLGAAVVTLVSRCNAVHTGDPVFNINATAKIDLAVEATAVTPLDPGVAKPLKPLQVGQIMNVPTDIPIFVTTVISLPASATHFDLSTVILRVQVADPLAGCRYQAIIELVVHPAGNTSPKRILPNHVLQPCSPGVPPPGPQLQLQPGDLLLSSITPIGASLPAGTKVNLEFQNVVVATDP